MIALQRILKTVRGLKERRCKELGFEEDEADESGGKTAWVGRCDEGEHPK